MTESYLTTIIYIFPKSKGNKDMENGIGGVAIMVRKSTATSINEIGGLYNRSMYISHNTGKGEVQHISTLARNALGCLSARPL